MVCQGQLLKHGKIAFGAEAVEESINKKITKLVIIAKDTSENSIKRIEKICTDNNVKYVLFGTIEENSLAIGKYNKAIIGVKDQNFAEAILKIISGGDTIE